jgi:glycosyltransferase involved in cell wall biosynthesis
MTVVSSKVSKRNDIKERSTITEGIQDDKPLVSIITVVFNGVATLEDTIKSVLSQRYDNIEYIIIDGGSNDGTVDIIRKYEKHLDHWISEADSGIYDAMNKGLALASGEIVGFLNSDDFYSDCFVLEKIANTFLSPEVEGCYGDLIYVTKDNQRVVRLWKSNSFVKGSFAKGWCPPHPTFYIRKSKINMLGFFDHSFKLAADVEFMMRYLEQFGLKAIYIPSVLVRMRIGGATNQSWRNVVKQNKEVITALRKNGIAYSLFTFFICKTVNRFWQFIRARFTQHS